MQLLLMQDRMRSIGVRNRPSKVIDDYTDIEVRIGCLQQYYAWLHPGVATCKLVGHQGLKVLAWQMEFRLKEEKQRHRK